jgi:ABC-type nitrate/sulfonate/bicarbonate transport system substrate-binding protein
LLRLSSYQIPAYAPQFLAAHLSFFEKGAVEFVSTRRGFGVAEAVARDEADILCGNVLAVLLDAMESDGPEQLVAFGLLNRQCYSFVLARKEQAFQWADLARRSLLVPTEYPSIWIAVRQALHNAGLRVDDTRVVLGFPALDAIAHYRSGLGDFLLAPPEMAPELYPVASVAAGLGAVPWSVYAVKRRVWEQRRPELEAFQAAITRAISWMGSRSDSEVAAAINARFDALSTSYLTALVGRYRAINLWPERAVISRMELDSWQRILTLSGLLRETVPEERYLAPGAQLI